ncbi:MAG TPA: hypothetical protein V6C93_30120 [Allocoleopsis sp.]
MKYIAVAKAIRTNGLKPIANPSFWHVLTVVSVAISKIQQRLATLKKTFDFFQILVKKEINRGHLVSAISYCNHLQSL